MNHNHFAAGFLLLGALTLSSGCDVGIESDPLVVPLEELTTELTGNPCQLNNFSFRLREKERMLNLKYEGQLLVAATMHEKGTAVQQNISFNYREDGKILSCLLDTISRVDYIYNEQDMLVRIDGTGNMMTRAFLYDDRGRIINQTTFLEGKPHNTVKFEYDAKGRLVVAALLDGNSLPVETKRLEYDDMRNPFKNCGPWLNTMEMALGYPIANGDNNVVRIATTYDKKTNYKIKGAIREAGEVVIQERKFEYNAEGYPIGITLERGDQVQTIALKYDCSKS